MIEQSGSNNFPKFKSLNPIIMKQLLTLFNQKSTSCQHRWKCFAFAWVLCAAFPAVAAAQTTLNAAGNSGSIAGNLYAYSIGEMVLVSTETSTNLVVTQGVLQANNGNMGVAENTFLAESLSLYPNPVENTLYLQPALPGGGELSVDLFDLRGRRLMQHKMDLQAGNERQELDLSTLQEGTYLLRATLQQDDRTYEHSFKVLKLGNY